MKNLTTRPAPTRRTELLNKQTSPCIYESLLIKLTPGTWRKLYKFTIGTLFFMFLLHDKTVSLDFLKSTLQH